MIIDKLGAGHYQTRDGKPVVILCLDAPGSYPVIGYAVVDGRSVYVLTWRSSGTLYLDSIDRYDLIPVPRKPREVWISAVSLNKDKDVRASDD